MSKPTLEYWQAKAELTRREALRGQNTAENLLRMTYAMEQARAIKETMLDFEEVNTMTKCKVCGYTSKEVTIINDLCSVHTCEICGKEGYADTDPYNRILCDNCHLDETMKREKP